MTPEEYANIILQRSASNAGKDERNFGLNMRWLGQGKLWDGYTEAGKGINNTYYNMPDYLNNRYAKMSPISANPEQWVEATLNSGVPEGLTGGTNVPQGARAATAQWPTLSQSLNEVKQLGQRIGRSANMVDLSSFLPRLLFEMGYPYSNYLPGYENNGSGMY